MCERYARKPDMHTKTVAQKRGGMPSIPGKDDVELFIKNNRKRCSYD